MLELDAFTQPQNENRGKCVYREGEFVSKLPPRTGYDAEDYQNVGEKKDPVTTFWIYNRTNISNSSVACLDENSRSTR